MPSRPVTPVPPVVIMASTSEDAIQLETAALIAYMSSGTMVLETDLWPAYVSRSTNSLPDLSSSSFRESDIVSTAMLIARKVLLSLIHIRLLLSVKVTQYATHAAIGKTCLKVATGGGCIFWCE